MAKLTTPNSTAVVDVPDELVARYVADGWLEEKPKAAPKAAPKRDKDK
ncbi:hypothetical protein KKR91_01165 [Arthrobacter jiangjiafuii]|uniref:Uncharacterized protein n=1 Tax=Arthrobacter jiangjiafuii TaxID=2817475 RepID=A0A975R183_9MICC|nr:hypothetical protein [Arthrobacter jiangjiafuii]MBP3044883.1 hypothetical protein [Arthrobacter jiangjiafuii]QWC10293.1 hypothetical protein KKR91_01165 [Arthrobacter jiangjiafuii]